MVIGWRMDLRAGALNDKFIEKDKQKLQNKVIMMGSGSCCIDFYESKK